MKVMSTTEDRTFDVGEEVILLLDGMAVRDGSGDAVASARLPAWVIAEIARVHNDAEYELAFTLDGDDFTCVARAAAIQGTA